MSVEVYIGVGSNMGQRFANLKAAWNGILGFLEDPEFSSLWETAPLIVEDQPEFLNMVFSGKFSGSALSLLSELQSIETAHGRNRTNEVMKGPRTLDLDILLFGSESVNTEILKLPHPGIRSRSFVLTPLLEIYPEDGEFYNEYRQSLNSLNHQEIRCRRDRSVEKFWEAGEPDEQ